MFNLFGSKVPQIDVTDVKNAVESHNEKFILLDVRTTGEYSKGKIACSINLPLDQVGEKITTIIPDKNSLVYVFCLSGSRSESAAQIMIKLGYTKVFNMTSGMLAWRAKGYKVE